MRFDPKTVTPKEIQKIVEYCQKMGADISFEFLWNRWEKYGQLLDELRWTGKGYHPVWRHLDPSKMPPLHHGDILKIGKHIYAKVESE